jgi:hypothetical protein
VFHFVGKTTHIYRGNRVAAAAFAVLGIAATISLGGCQGTMLSNDRIISNTAGILGVPPSDVTISDRRADGPTNTYYIAHVKSGGEYACVINGGGMLAMGMTNPPSCTRK